MIDASKFGDEEKRPQVLTVGARSPIVSDPITAAPKDTIVCWNCGLAIEPIAAIADTPDCYWIHVISLKVECGR